jgi:hypothetical protein
LLGKIVLLMNTNNYIYESPDGGKTLYRRKFNDYTTKEIYSKELDKWIIV